MATRLRKAALRCQRGRTLAGRLMIKARLIAICPLDYGARWPYLLHQLLALD